MISSLKTATDRKELQRESRAGVIRLLDVSPHRVAKT